MGFPSAWAGGRSGIYGPTNNRASSVWGIRADGRPDIPGPVGDWAFKDIESAGHGYWAWIQGTYNVFHILFMVVL